MPMDSKKFHGLWVGQYLPLLMFSCQGPKINGKSWSTNLTSSMGFVHFLQFYHVSGKYGKLTSLLTPRKNIIVQNKQKKWSEILLKVFWILRSGLIESNSGHYLKTRFFRFGQWGPSLHGIRPSVPHASWPAWLIMYIKIFLMSYILFSSPFILCHFVGYKKMLKFWNPLRIGYM